MKEKSHTNTYQYIGPVYRFENLVIKEWKGVTEAISIEKAKANFQFRIKRELGLIPSSKVRILDKQIKQIGGYWK